MFSTLFLGAVLAIFLTHGAVRGDAERGLLQPLVVRPIGRTALLAGRFVAAALVCCAAGLLGQIADALAIGTLEDVARAVAWALPFEALYQAGLEALPADSSGATRFLVRLGPFGGAQEGGALLWPWTAAWVGVVLAAGRAAFARRDL